MLYLFGAAPLADHREFYVRGPSGPTWEGGQLVPLLPLTNSLQTWSETVKLNLYSLPFYSSPSSSSMLFSHPYMFDSFSRERFIYLPP